MTIWAIDMTGPTGTYSPPRFKTAAPQARPAGLPRPQGSKGLACVVPHRVDAPCSSPSRPAEGRRPREGEACFESSGRPTLLTRPGSANSTEEGPSAPYTVAGYRRAIARACEAAAFPAWSPHGLRHAAASEFRREFGEESARLVLGHSKIDTTRLYGETDQRRAAEAAQGEIG